MTKVNSLTIPTSYMPLAVDMRSLSDVAEAIKAIQEWELENLADVTAYVPDNDPDSFDGVLRPYEVRNGTAVIPLKGFLFDGPYSFGSMATGYGYVRDAMSRAAEDDSVERIALDVNSPGGSVAGMFELAEFIAAFDAKPVKAFVRHSAMSAAYATISGANEIVLSTNGAAGSIGAITEHASVRRALEAEGVDVKVIAAGKHKADGHPALDLSESAEGKMRALVQTAFDKFAALVAKHREIDLDAVKAQESDFFIGEEALERGLVDKVADASEALLEYVGGNDMTKKTEDVVETFSASDVQAARSEAHAEGAKAERERIRAILELDAAKGREEFAIQMCLETDLGVNEAKALLEKVPVAAEKTDAEEPKAKTVTPFEEAMAQAGDPVPAAAAAEEKEMDPVKDILSAYRAATH